MRLGSIFLLLLLSYFFNPLQPVVDQPLDEVTLQSDLLLQWEDHKIDASVIELKEEHRIS